MIFVIIIFIVVAFSIGFWNGAAYNDAQYRESEEIDRLNRKIAYLESLVVRLDGPADWEDRFTKEEHRSELSLRGPERRPGA